MRKTTLLTAALGTALLAGAAVAQSTQTNQPPSTTNAGEAYGATPANTPLAGGEAAAMGRLGTNAPGTTQKQTTTVHSSGTMNTMPTEQSPTYNSTGTSRMYSTETPSPVMTTRVVTNGPVPDTAENRSRYGAPMSRAGKRTAPAGN